MVYLLLVLGISLGSLLVAALFVRQVLSADDGTADMQRIANAIREGAEAFLRRQYQTIAALSLVLAAILFLFYYRSKGSELAWKTTISFLIGAASSAIAGIVAM